MEQDKGLSVGVHGVGGINWYRAHSMNRRKKDGAMIVFALDDKRTMVTLTAAKFAGVMSQVRDHNGNLYPDILDTSYPKKAQG